MDDDTAWDILNRESAELTARIVTLAQSVEGAQFDEYDHHLLFYSFEVLFALDAAKLFSWYHCPTQIAARELMADYLRRWSGYFIPGAGASEEHTAQRRAVIEATSERFIAGCVAHHSPAA